MDTVISQILDIAIEIILIYLLFSKELSNSKIRYMFCNLINTILLIVLYLFPSKFSLTFIDLIICLTIVFLLLDNNWKEKIASAFLIYTMDSLVYQSCTMITNTILGIPIFSGMNNYVEKSFSKIMTIILLIVILFIKQHMHFYFYLSFSNKIFLSLFSLVVTFLISFLRYNQSIISDIVLHATLIICFTTICAIISYLFSASQKNYHIEQNQVQAQYIHILKTYYAASEANEKEVRKIRHDMKNHIRALNNLIASGKYEEVQDYIKQIDDFTAPRIKSAPNTGNALINAVLLQKSSEFPDISIEVKGFAARKLPINDYDICTIISNLLDNALEYSAIHQFSKVDFYIFQDETALLIKISNQVAEEINIKQLGKFSSKSGRAHGYGIENVREAINRNHGSFRYEQIGNRLYANVELFFSE